MFFAELHFFKCIALQLQPLLLTYQTNRPMVCFLSDELCLLIRSLMRRFIKPDTLGDLNDENLVRLDVTDKQNHVEYKQVDVGFSSEKALKKDGRAHVPSDKQILEFRMECKNF